MRVITVNRFHKYGILIDPDDKEKVAQHSWYINEGGYVRAGTAPFFYLHHLIHGKQEGLETDHINNNKLDNRKINLRHISKAENLAKREFKSKAVKGD